MTNSIGKHGEVFVTRTCGYAFLADFVYPNPMYRKGKLLRELADALIVFDQTWVIVQIKSANPTAHASYTIEDEYRWRREQTAKAASQVGGAAATLRRGTLLQAVNAHGRPLSTTCGSLDRLYGLVIVDSEKVLPKAVTVETLHPHTPIPTLYLSFGEFLGLCQELTTIGDLLDYLAFRLERCRTVIFLGGNELDLLASFRSNRISLDDPSSIYDGVMVEDGVWDRHRKHAQVVDRDRQDVVSYIVDEIAALLHRAVEFNDPHSVDFDRLQEAGLPPSRQYQEVVQELAKLRRVERRGIGEKLLEKSKLYYSSGRPRFFWVAYENRIPMLFLVHNGNRAERVIMLRNLALAAKVQGNRTRMLAVATETIDHPQRTVDCILLDSPVSQDVNELGPERVADIPRLFSAAVEQVTYEYDPALAGAKRGAVKGTSPRFKRRRRRSR